MVDRRFKLSKISCLIPLLCMSCLIRTNNQGAIKSDEKNNVEIKYANVSHLLEADVGKSWIWWPNRIFFNKRCPIVDGKSWSAEYHLREKNKPLGTLWAVFCINGVDQVGYLFDGEVNNFRVDGDITAMANHILTVKLGDKPQPRLQIPENFMAESPTRSPCTDGLVKTEAQGSREHFRVENIFKLPFTAFYGVYKFQLCVPSTKKLQPEYAFYSKPIATLGNTIKGKGFFPENIVIVKKKELVNGSSNLKVPKTSQDTLAKTPDSKTEPNSNVIAEEQEPLIASEFENTKETEKGKSTESSKETVEEAPAAHEAVSAVAEGFGNDNILVNIWSRPLTRTWLIQDLRKVEEDLSMLSVILFPMVLETSRWIKTEAPTPNPAPPATLPEAQEPNSSSN